MLIGIPTLENHHDTSALGMSVVNLDTGQRVDIARTSFDTVGRDDDDDTGIVRRKRSFYGPHIDLIHPLHR